MTLSSCRAFEPILCPDADLELDGVDVDVEFEITPFLGCCCSENCPLSLRTCTAIGFQVATEPSEIGIVTCGDEGGGIWIKETAVAVGIVADYLVLFPAQYVVLLLLSLLGNLQARQSVRELCSIVRSGAGQSSDERR